MFTAIISLAVVSFAVAVFAMARSVASQPSENDVLDLWN